MSQAELPTVVDRATFEAERPASNLRDRVRSLQLPPLQRRTSWLNARTFGIAALLLTVTIAAIYFYQLPREAPAVDSATSSSPPLADAPQTGTPPAETTTTAAVTGPAVAVRPSPAATAPSPSPSRTATQTPPVRTAMAKPAAAAGAIALESKGYIIPAHRILVSPKVNGMLMSLTVEEGVRVKKGDVLGVIESIEYEADLKRAEATLELAKERGKELKAGGRAEEVKRASAELTEAKETMKRAEADYKRAQQLIQGGSMTQAEFDQFSAEYQAQRARIARLGFALDIIKMPARDEQLAQAQAQVAQAEADVSKARWRLENCTIRSPISGTILKKNAEEGNIVNAIAFNGSYSLCDMADLSDLEVDLNIQERDVSKVFQGQKCRVRAEAYPDRVYEGYVSRLMPIADRAKGAVPVRVKVSVPAEEEGIYLKPDMGAIVTFYAGGQGSAKPSGK